MQLDSNGGIPNILSTKNSLRLLPDPVYGQMGGNNESVLSTAYYVGMYCTVRSVLADVSRAATEARASGGRGAEGGAGGAGDAAALTIPGTTTSQRENDA